MGLVYQKKKFNFKQFHVDVLRPFYGTINIIVTNFFPDILIVTPIYNSISILQQCQYRVRPNHVFIDNASTDGTPEWLTANGHRVVRFNDHFDRIKSWKRCLDHFLEHETATWMKWLFVGDTLHDDWELIFRDAYAHFPDVDFFSFEYTITSLDKQTLHWKIRDHSRQVDLSDVLRQVVREGNCFGAPIGHAFSKRILAKNIELGGLGWVADMRLCLELARRGRYAYIAQPIGTFNMQFRKYYKQNEAKLSSKFEEYFVRELALDYLEDVVDASALRTQLDQWIAKIVTHKSDDKKKVNKACKKWLPWYGPSK